jgi:hypothetical protein
LKDHYGARSNDAKVPAVASDPGSPGQGGEDGADSGTLGDDPIPTIDPFELEEWDIRPFTDPRTGETYDIIDGRVIVAFTNPPVLPEMDPNYFDTEILPTDPYYMQFTVPEISNDPAIQAFIAAENLTVYSEWNTVKGIGAVLPEGQTVEDAVANWPMEYAGLIEEVSPDRIVNSDAWPLDDPNDDDSLVHERPDNPRRPAQGLAARTFRCDKHHPDENRRCEGDRACTAAAQGQGRRIRDSRANSRRKPCGFDGDAQGGRGRRRCQPCDACRERKRA